MAPGKSSSLYVIVLAAAKYEGHPHDLNERAMSLHGSDTPMSVTSIVDVLTLLLRDFGSILRILYSDYSPLEGKKGTV